MVTNIEKFLKAVMAEHPDLNDFGIGIFYKDQEKPIEERAIILAKNREKLRESVERVSATVKWLRENVEHTKSVNRKSSSYTIKHIAEKDIGYITNGVFIAAGIIAGYVYRIRPTSPNVLFGMSERSLNRLRR